MSDTQKRIQKLDANTINQIAAGEVVERPASVVKELVENAVDSGASAVTVEIKDGGTSLIRVTDNGCGIPADQIAAAFEAHATSKLMSIDDIYSLSTLGFRGEALSSIAAVAQVELVTRTADELSGTRVIYENGRESLREEVGAPAGTTVIVRDLFGNIPARRKFLKTPQTEGSYVSELMEHLALDEPTVSMHFISNKQDRFTTSGNGDLKELIYRLYGRDVSTTLVPISVRDGELYMDGYLGEPALNRSNRNFELFFVNGRYIRDKLLSRALEDGYQQYLMQHKFPFAVLHLHVPPQSLDVNVHPSKLEVRFDNPPLISDFVRRHVEVTLHQHEMIPRVSLEDTAPTVKRVATATGKEASPAAEKQALYATEPAHHAAGVSEDAAEYAARDEKQDRRSVPEPFEFKRLTEGKLMSSEPVFAEGITPEPLKVEDDHLGGALWNRILGDIPQEEPQAPRSAVIKNGEAIIVEKGVQMDFFGEKLIDRDKRDRYRVLGQVFGTYWLITCDDQLLIVDQHAAHEKVNYERMIRHYKEGSLTSQLVSPPTIITLSAAEEEVFLRYRGAFERLGFNIENFGGREYAMRAVPAELFGCDSERDMFREILDDLAEYTTSLSEEEKTPDVINYRVAGMACKASVKGNTTMSAAEMEELIDELLTLDNPYNCPHGRPTMIKLSKYELDKKFKRIVT